MMGQICLVSDDGKDVESVLRQTKRLALLAYLALPETGTWHRRDVLLGVFWPELDDSHARASLRSALHALRKAVGESVIRTRGDDEISVDPHAFKTDVSRVWQALRDNRIDDALEEYRGDLLPGLYPPGSEGFQRWLDSERERLRSAVVRAATQQLNKLEANESRAQALTVGRRVIEIEPDDETLVRRVMLLHESVGDRAGALAVFEGYRERLAREFEAEPAPETLAIANRLRESVPLLPRAWAREPVPRASVAPRMTVYPDAREAKSSPRVRIITASAIAAAAVIAVVAWRSSATEGPMSIGHISPITSDEGLQVEASISPNGRLVAYARGNTSALRIFVQKIGGGPAWALTSDSNAVEQMPRWAPDNDQILFLSRANAYVSPSVGGVPQLVARGMPGDGIVRSAVWSPTGDSIAIVRNDSLIVQPLHGGRSRFVGTGQQLHSCKWSPDATRIACVSGNWVSFEPGPLFGNDAPSAIVVFNVSGGSPVNVTGRQFQNSSPAWSSDGKFLWMLSNRGGIPGEAYSVPIGSDGRPSGAYVRAGITAESIDMSTNRIAYSVPVRRANVWSIAIPDDKPLALADARQVTSGTQLIETISVSSDGKWLLYDSDLYGNADVFRMAITGGPAERLTDNAQPEYMGALSPDAREIALHRWVNGSRRVFVKSLSTGSEIEVSPADSGDQGGPRWSPDGRSLAIWKHQKEQGESFVVHRGSDSKWQSPAWRLAGAQLPAWSPDGRTLAFVRYDGGIDAMPADSGTRRSVYSRRPGTADPIASNLVWNLGPATIWFIGSDQSGHGGIWSVPASGGGMPRLRVNLDDPSGRLHGPLLASDGRRFYFTVDERFSNLRWAELTRR